MLNIDKNNKVTPDPETLRVKGFKDIWDKDKSQNKDTALNIFAYIYFKYNPKSAYRRSSVGEELQEKLIKDILQKKSWKIPKYVQEAERIYEDSMNTVGMKLISSGLAAAEMVTEFLKDFDLDVETDESKKLKLAADLLSVLSNVDTAVLKLTAAMKKVEEEFKSQKRTKKAVTDFENPKSKR